MRVEYIKNIYHVQPTVHLQKAVIVPAHIPYFGPHGSEQLRYGNALYPVPELPGLFAAILVLSIKS